MTVLTASLGPTVFTASKAAEVSPHQRLCHLSIARASLDDALMQLAEQCGLQLAHLANIESGRLRVGPLSGFLTPEEALDRLLLTTGLTYRFINDHTVAIVRRPGAAAWPHGTSTAGELGASATPTPTPAPTPTPGHVAVGGKNGGSRQATGRTGHLGLLSWFLTLFAVCGTMSLHPGRACAQEAASNTLQEVVVTAERRAVNMQTTSVSETAVSGSAILDKHIEFISDLEGQVPGLSVTTNGFTQNVNIRGMGNGTTSPTITTGVPVFRDGLYQPEAILLEEPFYDIADVEVLRGPQGTIIGQNSTGGALVINSANPNFNGINGYAEAIDGNYDERKLDGAVNLPINDVLAARVAFNMENRNSFFENIGPQIGDANAGVYPQPGGIDEKNARLGLLYKPNDKFQALAKIEVNYLNTGGLTPRPVPPCSICAPDASFYQYGYNGPSIYNGFQNLNNYQLDYNIPEYMVEEANRYSLELRYVMPGDITLRSLTGDQVLSERRIDDSTAAATPAADGGFSELQNIGPDPYYSQEFDLISPDVGRVTWLAGTSYFYRSTPVDQVDYPYGAIPAPGATNATVHAVIGTHVHMFGVFGQVAWDIVPALKLTVGARYSDDSQTTSGFIALPLAGLTISNVGKFSNKVPTGKVALNWAPVDGQNLYAFWARGFKDGGVNNATSTFQPEHINDYEIGWKGQFLDDHLRTQLGAYYMQYDDMQEPVLNPLGGGTAVINLSNSKIDGVEFSTQARLGQWSGSLGLAYNHSVLGAAKVIASYEFPSTLNYNLPQCLTGQSPGATCNDYSPYLLNLSGEQNSYSPTFQGNISMSYTFDLSENSTLAPRVDYSYTGKQWASIFQNTNFFQLSARRLLDLYLTYGYKSWNVQFFMHNATNQQYIQGFGGDEGTAGTVGMDAFWGDPRTYGVSIMRSF